MAVCLVFAQAHIHRPEAVTVGNVLACSAEWSEADCSSKVCAVLVMQCWLARSEVYRLGCGLDGLEWREVRHILQEVFEGSNIVVDVYTP